MISSCYETPLVHDVWFMACTHATVMIHWKKKMGRHTKHNLLLDTDIRKPNQACETLNDNKTLIMKISTSIERSVSRLIG
jgi:hypothetical protein